MDAKALTASRVLAENLTRLRQANPLLSTQLALAAKAGVAEGTIHRMSKGTNAATIENVQAVARAFGLQGWQLLVPGLDPLNPPRLYTGTDEAQRRAMLAQLADLASQISEQLKR